MNSIYYFIFVQWIPDHSAIPGNELDDKAAKEVTTIATNAILPLSFSSFMQVIDKTIRDNPPTHEPLTQVY